MKKVAGKNGGTLNRLEKGETANKSGRPKGRRNRATLVKWLLSQSAAETLPKATFQQLKSLYPGIDDMTIEEVMHLAQIAKSIDKRDTYAYNSVLDSAYGKANKIDDDDSDDVKVTIDPETKTVIIQSVEKDD